VLLARQDAMISSYRLSGVVSEANSALGELEVQLEDALGLLDEVSPESEDLKTEIERLLGEVGQIENDLGEGGRGANMVSQIEGVTGAPTANQLLQIEESWDEIPAFIDRLNILITSEVPALYARLDDAGIRPNPGSVIEMPRRRR
jgi:ABC-type transporter Mla subunit MlaD